ncbi:MAG: hypothetical protein K2J71_00095 [Oscillospiraceae bacterium]|nr:hypothetical protein [Oscillospiraceae bacterium]
MSDLKKLSRKESIMYAFELLIMLFDIFMALSSFFSISAFVGILFLLSGFLISPFCEKLFRKIPSASFETSIITRIGVQIISSIVLFIIAVAVGASKPVPDPVQTTAPPPEIMTSVSEQAESEPESITTTMIETEAEAIITETEPETTITTTTTVIKAETTTSITTIPETEVIATTEAEINTETIAEDETLLSHDMIAAILQLSLQENMENSTVTYDEDEQAYVVSVWEDGLALSIATMESASTEWKNLKTSFVNSANTLWDSVKELDADSDFYLQILNDQNRENALLIIYNGLVIYDVLA